MNPTMRGSHSFDITLSTEVSYMYLIPFLRIPESSPWEWRLGRKPPLPFGPIRMELGLSRITLPSIERRGNESYMKNLIYDPLNPKNLFYLKNYLVSSSFVVDVIMYNGIGLQNPTYDYTHTCRLSNLSQNSWNIDLWLWRPISNMPLGLSYPRRVPDPPASTSTLTYP
jgi:hypothetical protein